MKYVIKSFVLAAIATTTFSGCTKDMDSSAVAADGKASFFAEIADVDSQLGTRADIEVGDRRFTYNWVAGDQMGVTVVSPEGDEGVKPFLNDGTSFTGTLTSAANGTWKYGAYFPYSALGTSKAIAKVAFSSTRTQQGNTFNSAYDAMGSDVVVCDASEPGKNPDGSAVTFSMHRVTSILYFELSSADAAVSGEKVKSVSLTANKGISSPTYMSFYFNPAGGAFDVTKSQAALDTNKPASRNITLFYEEGSEPSTADFKAYFNILPGDDYTVFTVTVRTENHKSTFTIDHTGKQITAGKMYRKVKTIDSWTEFPTEPQVIWLDSNIDEVHEITPVMDVRINVLADRGIKDFKVKIESQSLTPLLAMLGLATEMDLVNPALPATPEEPDMAEGLQSLGFPVRGDVLNQPEVVIDISGLVPMILFVSNLPSEDHTFILTVTDNLGNTKEQSIRFHSTKVVE